MDPFRESVSQQRAIFQRCTDYVGAARMYRIGAARLGIGEAKVH
jgi:hypothetical protein